MDEVEMQENKQRAGNIVIKPEHIQALTKVLAPQEFTAWMGIVTLNAENHFMINRQILSQVLNITPTSVSRITKKLIKKGAIKYCRLGSTKNSITFIVALKPKIKNKDIIFCNPPDTIELNNKQLYQLINSLGMEVDPENYELCWPPDGVVSPPKCTKKGKNNGHDWLQIGHYKTICRLDPSLHLDDSVRSNRKGKNISYEKFAELWQNATKKAILDKNNGHDSVGSVTNHDHALRQSDLSTRNHSRNEDPHIYNIYTYYLFLKEVYTKLKKRQVLTSMEKFQLTAEADPFSFSFVFEISSESLSLPHSIVLEHTGNTTSLSSTTPSTDTTSTIETNTTSNTTPKARKLKKDPEKLSQTLDPDELQFVLLKPKQRQELFLSEKQDPLTIKKRRLLIKAIATLVMQEYQAQRYVATKKYFYPNIKTHSCFIEVAKFVITNDLNVHDYISWCAEEYPKFVPEDMDFPTPSQLLAPRMLDLFSVLTKKGAKKPIDSENKYKLRDPDSYTQKKRSKYQPAAHGHSEESRDCFDPDKYDYFAELEAFFPEKENERYAGRHIGDIEYSFRKMLEHPAIEDHLIPHVAYLAADIDPERLYKWFDLEENDWSLKSLLKHTSQVKNKKPWQKFQNLYNDYKAGKKFNAENYES